MAKITFTLNPADLARIIQKGTRIEKNLVLKQGEVYKYVFTVADGYNKAVLSGIGKTSTGVLSLREFLGEVKRTYWKPLHPDTLQYKASKGWTLQIWKASGAVEDAVRISVSKESTGIDLFSGIDGNKFPDAFKHAILAEYGGKATEPPYGNVDDRALFTLLNILIKNNADVILKGISEAIQREINKHWR